MGLLRGEEVDELESSDPMLSQNLPLLTTRLEAGAAQARTTAVTRLLTGWGSEGEPAAGSRPCSFGKDPVRNGHQSLVASQDLEMITKEPDVYWVGCRRDVQCLVEIVRAEPQMALHILGADPG